MGMPRPLPCSRLVRCTFLSHSFASPYPPFPLPFCVSLVRARTKHKCKKQKQKRVSSSRSREARGSACEGRQAGGQGRGREKGRRGAMEGVREKRRTESPPFSCQGRKRNLGNGGRRNESFARRTGSRSKRNRSLRPAEGSRNRGIESKRARCREGACREGAQQGGCEASGQAFGNPTFGDCESCRERKRERGFVGRERCRRWQWPASPSSTLLKAPLAVVLFPASRLRDAEKSHQPRWGIREERKKWKEEDEERKKEAPWWGSPALKKKEYVLSGDHAIKGRHSRRSLTLRYIHSQSTARHLPACAAQNRRRLFRGAMQGHPRLLLLVDSLRLVGPWWCRVPCLLAFRPCRGLGGRGGIP